MPNKAFDSHASVLGRPKRCLGRSFKRRYVKK